MNSMNYLGKFINNFRYVYNEINAATLTGAIDVVVVEQPDGSFTCSPFHVRFGKIGVLRSREKVVDIEINGEPVDIHMKLGESGEAFFVEEVSVEELGDESIPPHLACSPIPREGSFHDRYSTDSANWAPDRLDGRGGEDVKGEEGESEISSTPKVVVAGGGSVVKTFRAEPVEAEVSRKLSAEFKEKETESSTESLAQEQSKEEVASSASGKRKRRKRSLLKKKQSGASRQQAESSTTEQQQQANLPECDAIFPMEDVVAEQPKAVATEEAQQVSNSEELAFIKDAPVETDIHFFSDTELTPGCSPNDSRQFTPVQSDTEFETKRGAEGEEGKAGEGGHQQSWRWGELPTSTLDDASKEEAQRSMLHNMLGLMKKTKHIRHHSQEGVYLSELDVEQLAPEVAALYFSSGHKQTAPEPGREDDAESGNGPSLPHSPPSGLSGGPKSVDSDFEEPKKMFCEISMSLCGGLTTTSTPTEEAFLHHIITYEEFVSNPTVVNNPNLVVRVDGKMHTWRSAGPVIMSLAAFQKPLPQEVVSRLCSELTPAGVRSRRSGYSSWFTWGVRSPQPDAESENQQQTVTDAPITPQAQGKEFDESQNPKAADTQTLGSMSAGDQCQRTNSSDSDSDNERRLQSLKLPVMRDGRVVPSQDKYRKTLRLTSEQIKSLNLRDGANEIEFSVTTAYQGTSRCKCFLFKWRYDDKIVVSDIDGTITKSDVLGHILPIVGKDWAQSGVAKLFTKIKDNGYKLLYLSARAIGQSRLTREYLKSVKQEDLSLPEGPMLLNPTSLLNALHTEVIEKKPEEFKISCLRDIQALFPPNSQPFYAGYGNKINDVWAYQAVGIPIVRIFTINHRGELKHELTQTFQSSYSGQSCIVNDLFPPMIAD